MYSTCSILRKENDIVIKEFLKENPTYICEEHTIEPTEKQDGFFIAKLIKSNITSIYYSYITIIWKYIDFLLKKIK